MKESIPQDAPASRAAVRPTIGNVYLLGPMGFSYLKIGFTMGALEKRVAALQVGNHEELEVFCVIRGRAELERDLHYRFAQQHERGEWFRHEGGFRVWTRALDACPPPEVAFLRRLGWIRGGS